MTDDPYHIRIKHKPIPWAAHAGYGKRAYNPRQKDRDTIQWQIKLQWNGRPLLEHPLEVWFSFGFEPPKSVSKKKRAAMIAGLVHHAFKPDTTNLQKFAEDCLKKIVIQDDNIIFRVHSEKFWADEEHITIAFLEHEDLWQ